MTGYKAKHQPSQIKTITDQNLLDHKFKDCPFVYYSKQRKILMPNK